MANRFDLTPAEYDLLNGLRYAGQPYVSASEHNLAIALCERGLANAWQAHSGAYMWRLSRDGLSALIAYEEGRRS